MTPWTDSAATLFFTGTELCSWAVPLALVGHVVAIAYIAWRTQLHLWRIDTAANVDGNPEPRHTHSTYSH